MFKNTAKLVVIICLALIMVSASSIEVSAGFDDVPQEELDID